MVEFSGRYFYGTGRRKTAVARVRLYPADDEERAIIVNGKEMTEYFRRQLALEQIMEPLEVTGTTDAFNLSIKVKGGGISGQAGAIRHGIARALLQADESLRPILRKGGFLTRDPRMKERKKPGLKRARKAPQYTKR
ncbi:MAG: 30S ribosomal protein S9 [Anaerolineae bacterium]